MDDELANQICGILTHAPEAYHRVLVFVTGDGNAHKVGWGGVGFGWIGGREGGWEGGFDWIGLVGGRVGGIGSVVVDGGIGRRAD